ncbi:hypothetical protein [Sinomonas sp. P47F7]|uniref:hypothetical protein n=1 Tax=Sinomonas sp. P47F7 TaxID=3410987 RepID=UPI003BF5C655
MGVLQQVERVADLLSEERSVRLDGLSFAGENGALGIEAARFGEEEIAGECVVYRRRAVGLIRRDCPGLFDDRFESLP